MPRRVDATIEDRIDGSIDPIYEADVLRKRKGGTMRSPLGEHPTDADYSRARAQAAFSGILDILRRHPRELLPFEEVRSHFLVRGQYDRGIRLVPLSKIVGSQGRYTDFDRSFLPRVSLTKERWTQISLARYRNIELPPIELYKLGDIYFVIDGNHRVSVARHAGQFDIRAHVMELVIDVPLAPGLQLADLIPKEEQSDFFDWTNLAQLRPGCMIEVTELGSYLDLIRHINWQRTCLSVLRATEVSSEEAVLDWYDTVYTPLASAIQASNVLRSFPGRTETDLYLWIMDHGHDLLYQAPDGSGNSWLAGIARRLTRLLNRRRLR